MMVLRGHYGVPEGPCGATMMAPSGPYGITMMAPRVAPVGPGPESEFHKKIFRGQIFSPGALILKSMAPAGALRAILKKKH